MPQNADPRVVFEQNVNFINAMNALFVQQEVSFSMAVNTFSALSFQEFALRQSGMGVFVNEFYLILITEEFLGIYQFQVFS